MLGAMFSQVWVEGKQIAAVTPSSNYQHLDRLTTSASWRGEIELDGKFATPEPNTGLAGNKCRVRVRAGTVPVIGIDLLAVMAHLKIQLRCTDYEAGLAATADQVARTYRHTLASLDSAAKLIGKFIGVPVDGHTPLACSIQTPLPRCV